MRRSKRARRRLLAGLGVVVVLGIGSLGYVAISSMQKSRLRLESRDAGMAAYEEGRLEDALKSLAVYIAYQKDDLQADDIDVLMAFGDARSRIPQPNRHHIAEAITYNRLALEFLDANPSAPDAAALRSELLHRQVRLYATAGAGVELLATAEAIIAIDPDDIEALRYKAVALCADRRFVDAEPVADRLIELQPEEIEWRELRLAVMAGQGSDYQEILALCDAWMADGDRDGRYALLKAELEAQSGAFDDARADALLAADAGAGGPELLGRLVSLMDRLDLREEATAMIVRSRAEHPSDLWVREAAIRRLWQSDEIEAALQALSEARADFEDVGPVLRRLEPVLLASADRLDECRAALQDLEARGVAIDRSWARALLAWTRLDGTNYPEVVDELTMALAVEPNDPILNFVLGRTLHNVGELAVAVEALERAAAREPNWVAASAALADSLLRSGRTADAYAAARDLTRRASPRHLEAHLIFCRAYLALRASGGEARLIARDSGSVVDIVEVLEPLYERLPDHVELATMLLEAYVVTGRLPRAQDMLREAASSETIRADVLLALADRSRRLGLDLEGPLLARVREMGVAGPAAEIAEARGLGRDDVDAALAALDRVIAETPAAEVEARKARVELLRGDGRDGVNAELRHLVSADRESLVTISWVLVAPETWDDEPFAAALVERMRRMLGPRAHQVRLAEARLVLEFHADDEAKLAEAIIGIGEVLESAPESIAALTTMAAALQLGPAPNLARAADYLEQVVTLHPGQASVCVQLVDLLQKTGDFAGAQRYLAHLARLTERRPELKRARIDLLRQQGDFEAAREEARVLAAMSGSVNDQLLLAAMHQRVGRQADAERIYDKLLRERPDDALVTGEAAGFYARTGRFGRGLQLMQKLRPDGGPAAREILLAAFCERHGRVEEAERWWREAVALDPASAEAHHHLAQNHLRARDFEGARAEALEALRLDESHEGARLTLVLCSLNGDAASRRRAMRDLEQLNAGHDDLLATLALLDRIPAAGDGTKLDAEDLAAAVAVVDAHPAFLPAWYLAITMHIEGERLEQAITLARRAVGRFPMNAEPSRWATQVLMQTERWSEALVEADEWRRRSLEDPLPADLAIGSILVRMERADDAVRQLTPHEARLLVEDRFPSLGLYVEALLRSGAHERALSLLGDRVEREAEWRRLLGAVAAALDAEPGVRLLAELQPLALRDPAESLDLAGKWAILGRRTGDTSCFDRADMLVARAAGDPDQAREAAIMEASIAEARGDLAEAERLYRAVIAQDPSNVACLNNLAVVLVRSGQSGDEALRFAERALALAPGHPDLLDTHAMALLAAGRPAEAEESVRQALAQRPNDVGFGLTLVESMLATGALDDAINRLHQVERRIEQARITPPAVRARFEDLRQRLRQVSAAGS